MRNNCIQELKSKYQELQIYRDYNILLICEKKEWNEAEEILKEFRIQMCLEVDEDADFLTDKINWDKIVENRIDLILVVLPIVYSRKMAIELGSFCKCFAIRFIDMYQHDLVHLYDTEISWQKEYQYRNLAELKSQIDCHEVISFDIFDTLLCRKLIWAESVFDIVAYRCSLEIEKFHKRRSEIEKKLDNPDIYEIYDVLQNDYGWSRKETQSVMQCEVRTEQEVLVARKSMREAFYYAVSEEKTVYLLSDMYLTKDILTRILKKNGIKGYQDIWLSCEKKKTKYSGMFLEYKAEIGNQSCLHIGDNWSVDGICAENAGIDIYLIQGINDLLGNSVYAPALSLCHTVNDSILLGMIAEKMFNDPFVLYQKTYHSNSLQMAAYTHIGPVMAEFMIWLTDQLKNSKYDKIIFPARDGFLIEKLYKQYIEKNAAEHYPESVYIETSRNAAMVADVRYKRDVREMLKSCPYQDAPEILEKRFLIMSDERRMEELSTKKTEDLIWQYKDMILERSKELRAAYQEFLKKSNVEQNKKYAFFDLVSSGTSQLHLASILKSDMTGLYFYHNEPDTPEKKKLPINAFGNYDSVIDSNSAVRRKYLLLEFILSSENASVKYIDENGYVHYEKEKRKQKEIQMMKSLQKGIVTFLAEYLKLHCAGCVISKQMPDYIFDCVDKKGNCITNADFYKIRIYDDWSDVYIDCLSKG